MHIAVDETLLDDLKNVLLVVAKEIVKSREREDKLLAEVDRHKPMTEEQAAEYLGRDVDTLRYYRSLGLNSFKKGGSRWYTKALIDEWLESGRVNQRKR